ncbi:UDP-glycosyltransferase TURAN isoform X1 [Ziziphus jujuba]|uniref:UDP-glycosyltransferase TURAN isoform X1 n=1 Tax=Ziziphus jujuba TaxID=326968 RepID=A0ABM3IRA3_ZIZJJ|nr:UDP-glycosyltransferase TURAN isoform X1 [Ziziphus jujuba]
MNRCSLQTNPLAFRTQLCRLPTESSEMAGRRLGREGEKTRKRGRACVVVLGDIGRSPRMQFHALSLSRQASLQVDIVGYGGSEPYSAILEHQSINIYKMKQWPKFLQGLPWIFKPFVLLLKPLIQFLVLLWFLCFKVAAPDVFLVQNPPSVPTLVAVKWASWLRGSAFIIDWHNFGYTLLALSLGRSSRFVAVYRWFERRYGKMADGSLCVTRAMQHELAQNWGIKATVLYDQPPEFFHPASLEEKHKLFCRLNKNLTQPHGVHDCAMIGAFDFRNKDLNDTLFTTMVGTDIVLKPNRPAIVVSSTSWTPDEDFGILLEAAVMYDRRVAAILDEDNSTKEDLWKEMQNGKQDLYPRLLFIITGKGPEKEKYEEKIRRLRLKRVAFRTMWLSADDYPLLLGSADLGVCLHTSSSGLDLPMKVVDMFGCGLPVCAVSYSCIKELVKVEKNGLLFSSSSELADELVDLFKGFPDVCDTLKLLRNGALETGSSARWASEWEENAKPLIFEVISKSVS